MQFWDKGLEEGGKQIESSKLEKTRGNLDHWGKTDRRGFAHLKS